MEVLGKASLMFSRLCSYCNLTLLQSAALEDFVIEVEERKLRRAVLKTGLD